MARLVNAATGVTVTVSDETAARLGPEWAAEGGTEQTETPQRPQRSETPDATWKVAELTAYAAERNIALGDATKKDDILAVLAKAAESGSTPAGTGEDD